MQIGAREASAEEKEVVEDESNDHGLIVAHPGAPHIRVCGQTPFVKLRVRGLLRELCEPVVDCQDAEDVS